MKAEGDLRVLKAKSWSKLRPSPYELKKPKAKAKPKAPKKGSQTLQARLDRVKRAWEVERALNHERTGLYSQLVAREEILKAENGLLEAHLAKRPTEEALQELRQLVRTRDKEIASHVCESKDAQSRWDELVLKRDMLQESHNALLGGVREYAKLVVLLMSAQNRLREAQETFLGADAAVIDATAKLHEVVGR